MENECEALPGVAYPGVQDNRSTLNTKTGYYDDGTQMQTISSVFWHYITFPPGYIELLINAGFNTQFNPV